jgi:hypothetical protein
MRLGLTPRSCCTNSLGGTHPRHCGGLRDVAGVSPVTLRRLLPYGLTRRALEGGAATPSNCFLVNLQSQVVTLGRRDAIPATVGPVRPRPCSQRHAGRCYNHSDAVRHAGTGRRHACHCIPYGSSSATPSSPPGGATANHCAPTLEAATLQVQDTP